MLKSEFYFCCYTFLKDIYPHRFDVKDDGPFTTVKKNFFFKGKTTSKISSFLIEHCIFRKWYLSLKTQLK